ncbi:hypothetical protein MIND_01178800 [Mycena indigotica]|uniref:AAA-ATPase-like domain-containing protein n=1 Tax=Mycena indigotica TaxID=2126181 RepID=A0A8H6VT00_9AGAR|nr:uncharacterized protein MIND_01178800 [Mycena indigotica]KAF7292799.1 hypothetical protein MIND_01178800 [Mycena indigotica]
MNELSDSGFLFGPLLTAFRSAAFPRLTDPFSGCYSESDTEELKTDDELPGRKRLRLPTTSSFSSSADTSFRAEASSQHNLPDIDDLFNDLINQPEAYVDKTACIAQLPAKYFALLVRPPRFGKSTFLSTLAEYYDARSVLRDDDWSHLDVYKASTNTFATRDRHLCLLFCFPTTIMRGQPSDIEWDIRSHVSGQLYSFVYKYTAELGLSGVSDILEVPALHGQPNILAMFAKFWDIVKKSSYDIFVGVDDYDAAISAHEFLLSEDGEYDGRLGLRDTIEELLDTLFWCPLLDGIDVIAKLLVTGTLTPQTLNPQLSKSMSAFALMELPELALSCGFNDDEAHNFSGAFLPHCPSATDFRDLAGQYYFPPHCTSTPLLHPQQIILHIARLANKVLSPRLTTPFHTLSVMLESLQEDADDERVTINTLIDLLTQGTLEHTGYRPLHGWAFTVEALRDLGLLSYDPERQLRVASKNLLRKIHSTVYPVARAYFDLPSELAPALCLDGGFQRLLVLATKVLANRTRRSLSRRSNMEPTMHGVFELLFRSPISAWEDVYDSFILVPAQQLPYIDEKPSPDVEPRRWGLRTLTLRGLWRALNPNDGDPTFEALTALHEELETMEEPKIREMPFSDSEGIVSRVEDYLVPEQGVNMMVAVGGTRVLMPLASSLDNLSSAKQVD